MEGSGDLHAFVAEQEKAMAGVDLAALQKMHENIMRGEDFAREELGEEGDGQDEGGEGDDIDLEAELGDEMMEEEAAEEAIDDDLAALEKDVEEELMQEQQVRRQNSVRRKVLDEDGDGEIESEREKEAEERKAGAQEEINVPKQEVDSAGQDQPPVAAPARSKEELIADLTQREAIAKQQAVLLKRKDKMGEAKRVLAMAHQMRKFREALESKDGDGAPGMELNRSVLVSIEKVLSDVDGITKSETPKLTGVAAVAAVIAGGSSSVDVKLAKQGQQAQQGQQAKQGKQGVPLPQRGPSLARVATSESSVSLSGDGKAGSLSPSSVSAAAAASVKQIKQRLDEYKRAAVEAKQTQKMDRAKTLVMHIRNIKQLMQRAKEGKPVRLSELPPPLRRAAMPPTVSRLQNDSSRSLSRQPSTPEKATVESDLQTSTTVVSEKTTDLLVQRGGDESKREEDSKAAVAAAPVSIGQELEYDTLLQRLQAEVDELCRLAKEAHGAADKRTALGYFRQMKTAEQHRDMAQRARANGHPPPIYRFERVTERREVRFESIAPDALEMTIGGVKELAEPYSVYVIYELEYPSSEEPQKGQTKVAPRGQQAKFDHKHVFALHKRLRTSAAFHRRFGNAKLRLELWNSRSMWKDQLLGKGEIRLTALLERADIIEPVSIMSDGKDSKVVAQVELALRLRTPIKGHDIREVARDRIVIVSWDRQVAQPIVESQVEAGVPSRPEPVPASNRERASTGLAVNDGPSAGGRSARSASIGARGDEAAIGGSPGEDADAVEDVRLPDGVTQNEYDFPLDVRLFVSNDALEAEVARVGARLGQARAELARHNGAENKQNAATVATIAALEQRQQSLQLQLQVLVVQVQNGNLGLDEYLEQIKAAVRRDKLLASALSKSRNPKKRQEAVEVLRRVKITEAELEGAEANKEQLAHA